jgi:hypothetical protein
VLIVVVARRCLFIFNCSSCVELGFDFSGVGVGV